MKLFLASTAYATLDLVLPLLPGKPQNLKLAFIPTAADPYPADARPWMDSDRAKLVDMGFAVTEYDLKGKNAETLRADLAQYQVIFVSGGNTYYLLNEVKKSGFDLVVKELIDKGIVYIGSSAGSVIMCQTIDHARLIEHPELVPELTDYSGLGLTDMLIAPHYGNPKYSERYKQIKAQWGDKILLLRDDQAVIVNHGKTEIVTK
jgi:dipeptidase E